MGQEKIWDWVPGADFDAEHDLKDLPSWFLDGTHPIPAWKPFMSWLWQRACAWGLKYAAQKLSIPTCKGWEMHDWHGRDYVTFLIVRDPEEIKQREVKFREALRPYIEDFDGWWNKAKEEQMARYERIKSLDVTQATMNELYWNLRDSLDAYYHMWDIHFTGMYATFNAWITFEALCKEWWGITDQSPEFQKLMVGFDNDAFRMDKRLWQLAQEATKKGLADIFMTTEAREVIPKLEQTEAGREWLKELRTVLDKDGWKMERLCGIDEPTWIEDPTPAILNIKSYMAKGGGFVLDEVRKSLAKEREEAVAAIMQKVPEDQKEWFGGLLKLAQCAGWWSEEHTYYLEFYNHAVIRRCLVEMGKRCVQAGTFDQVDDIFFLNPEEIDSFILVPEFHNLRYIVNRRRQEWEQYVKEEPPPPVFTTRSGMEEAVEKDLLPSMDALAIKIVVGEMPEVRPELKADLYGLRGAPGIAEGPARVIMSLEQVHEVQPGEILVTPTTSTSWTPVFSLIKALVIDRGGLLSHAAIVGREFGIPTVVNTFEASAKIKTGQRIRVDGNEGTVYILSK